MRFKIIFSRTGRQRMLPMDYQYYLSAWIYKVIGKADREFANFLHTSGYVTGNKRFKLFSYSPLDFGKPVLWREKALFEIRVEEVSLNVSFHLAESAEKFIIGLFNNQEVYVGDHFNGLDLTVKQIERLPEPVLTDTMNYIATSPVVISQRDEISKYARYLAPSDPNYSHLLKQNMLNKLSSVPGAATPSGEIIFEFLLKNTPKSKLITMKPNTPEQSKVRGFVFEFKLTCPLEIHQLILATGVGEKNSSGCGWCEPIFR